MQESGVRSLRDHQVMSEAKKVMEEPVSEILSLKLCFLA